ncbi:MAG: integrase [Candidatus Bathyarchaeia archaeon]
MAGPLGFEPRTFSLEGAWQGTAENWNTFRLWLESKKFNRRYLTTLYNYAQQYCDCLFNRDLNRVRDLPDSQRPNVLKALSALAKFTGKYEDWKTLIKSYDLRWGGRSADDLIIDRLTKIEDPEEVWTWIRLVKQERPQLAELLDLLAVSGLRFIEGINSYNLIQQLNAEGKLDTYYVHDKSALEHFRFKEIFLRSSKKAFVSFVPQEVVKSICVSKELPSADEIQQLVRRRGLPLRFGDVREAHGTFMTRFLKREEIDFLHGRVTGSVFMQHYFNPALIGDLKERVFKGVSEILEKVKVC